MIDKKFICGECGKKFQTERGLKLHKSWAKRKAKKKKQEKNKYSDTPIEKLMAEYGIIRKELEVRKQRIDEVLNNER